MNDLIRIINENWVIILLVMVVAVLMCGNRRNSNMMVQEGFSDTTNTTADAEDDQSNVPTVCVPVGVEVDLDGPCVKKVYDTEDMDELNGKEVQLIALQYAVNADGNAILNNEGQPIVRRVRYLSRTSICPEELEERDCNTMAIMTTDGNSAFTKFILSKPMFQEDGKAPRYRLQAKMMVDGQEVVRNVSHNLNLNHNDRPVVCVDGVGSMHRDAVTFEVEPTGNGSFMMKFNKPVASDIDEGVIMNVPAYAMECNMAGYTCTMGVQNKKRLCVSTVVNPHTLMFYAVLTDEQCIADQIAAEEAAMAPEPEVPMVDDSQDATSDDNTMMDAIVDVVSEYTDDAGTADDASSDIVDDGSVDMSVGDSDDDSVDTTEPFGNVSLPQVNAGTESYAAMHPLNRGQFMMAANGGFVHI